MTPARKTSLIFGLFYAGTFVFSIPALFFYDPVLKNADYILGGGEVAAMVMIDAVVRLIPGVLGDEESNKQDSFSTANRLLEGPQFTRPREFRGLQVPEILLSGDHEAIARWRDAESFRRTRQRRADLLENGPEHTGQGDG